MKKHLQWHRVVRLRRRYYFTRGNVPRLRYVAGGGVFACLILFVLAMPGEAYVESGSLENEMAAAEVPAQETESYTIVNLTGAMQSRISDSIRRAAVAIQKIPDPRPRTHHLKVGEGETVGGILEAVGVSAPDSFQIVKAMSEHIDPRQIKAGQKMDISLQPARQGGMEFQKMSMKLDPTKEVYVEKQEDKFVSDVKEKELKKRESAAYAEIQTSLYGSAARAGIPPQVIAEVIRAYSWNIDFQRDIRQGDKIEVMYDTYETEDGEFARYGDVVYANLSVGGKDIPIYRFEMKDGYVDYFEPNGRSIRKTLMKTPVDGARISSGFGLRKHPILGYNKMHKGVDFAAPTGTPVYAAGNGTVEFAGRKGGYGNYLLIRHNSGLKTAYAHLHKFGKGISKGKRVEQGQVIAYVGTTGRSTGPHLHYEVVLNGQQVNPNSVNLPTGEQLKGKEFDRFKSVMAGLRQQYVSLTEGWKFAQNNASEDRRNIN